MGQQEATLYCPFINKSRVHGINKWNKLRSLLGELQVKDVKKLTQDVANDNQSALSRFTT
jgi:hypothetical protein